MQRAMIHGLVLTLLGGGGLAAQPSAIPLSPRPHMDQATLACYNRIRSAPGWFLGLGAFCEPDKLTGRIPPPNLDRTMRRWKELYGGSLPVCYEWELGERADRQYRRDWKEAEAWSRQGGLPWFMLTLKNFTVPWGPKRTGSANDRAGGLDPVMPGGPQHEAFVAYMTQLARELRQFGRPCVFRPFHEMNGGWFWWGAQPDKLKKTWRLVFEMFRHEGVTNVIWCWAASDFRPAPNFYPGDDVVDIIGTDQYFDGAKLPDTTRQRLAELASIGKDKPFFLTEVGPLAREDFWKEAAKDFEAVPRMRGMMLWMARGWKAWGSEPSRGSFIDETSPKAVIAAFKGFLASPKTLTLKPAETPSIRSQRQAIISDVPFSFSCRSH